MAPSTWSSLITAIFLIGLGGWFFRRWVLSENAKDIRDFRRWANWIAIFSAALILLSAVPFAIILPNSPSLRDVAGTAYAFGPLALTVSVTLASIFYSVGDWYDFAQRFRTLGITDARPNRKGRQADRAVHWQNVLSRTENRAVIVGVTLGGWFDTSWQDTRNTLLAVLPKAEIQVLLADPAKWGFRLRAEDPGELAEAQHAERPGPRAKKVYDRIKDVLTDPDFLPHIQSGRLTFYIYSMTPVSVVWVDEVIYFTPYLPYVSDSDCPEFSISRSGQMGLAISNAINSLIRRATKIETAADAAGYAGQCEQAPS